MSVEVEAPTFKDQKVEGSQPKVAAHAAPLQVFRFRLRYVVKARSGHRTSTGRFVELNYKQSYHAHRQC